ncbi:protein phosphatase PHLPP-like protein [Scaptodrosophila lebanonensis]|uniref:Protein phosphatase PHLPP-like protein n=1 Tax=Drosophila lebanonensis TaxID=7225 RepID=A0A6J2UE08_DROLE|nr:protein phosphatase PHLPP-like protein [Scaptodrosophila lebanonensis]
MLKATKKSTDIYKSKLKVKASNGSSNNNNNNTSSPPLKKLSLRGNQLCGSILIGNYNYLTQLEVCENEMEVLDLSSLAQLETLKCSRNKLMELIINGSNLQTLIADHNCLHSITTNPVPLKLQHIDLSHNYFSELPNWLGACVTLTALVAAHNQLCNVTVLLRTYRINRLRTLNLAYNALQHLERLPEAASSLQELQLQSNELQRLPENFFAVTHAQLRTMNASCNRLATLPRYEQNNNAALEQLSLAGNQLNDSIFEALIHAGKLKVLQLAYNRIGQLPPDCVRNWPDLEVLVLSGNMLQQLPEHVATLNHLQVLRVHSNLLLTTPQLAKLSKLRVLDLAHNHLDRVNLLSLVPRNLKYLDLSGNLQLQVDEQQLKVCQTQSQRHWSLIDVSGKNRAALPTSTRSCRPQEASTSAKLLSSPQKPPPWCMGFAETPGDCRKLLVSQLRLSQYRGIDEALYGMFEATDGSASVAQQMTQVVPRLLQQEQTVKETAQGDYMKYTLLAAQQQCGCVRGATLLHLTRAPAKVRPLKSKRYVLRVASTGRLDAYLVRRTTQLRLTVPETSIGSNGRTHALPDPELLEITLSNDDEYLVLGNAQLWAVMDIGRAAREIRKEENALLAAKRLQDIAQSFGANGNLSVIVVRFRHLGTDVDHLIRELKQSVRKKPPPVVALPPSVCKRTCCDRSNACRHRALEREPPLAGRSSPSGQSDQLQKDSSGLPGANDEFILAHARVLQEEQQLEMLDETESVLSEEQFKCWEYMLEQNTQLLFDKELNTISKSFTKQRKPNTPCNDRYDFKSNLMKSVTNKFISSSTPQLLHHSHKEPPPPQTLMPPYQQPQPMAAQAQHFGSTRSFQQSHGYNLFDAKPREVKLAAGGGPHAAYFGSLQRLMPYNFEYDFAVTQERNILDEEDIDEYSEHESRMRKYWGVATTEL